MLAKHYSPKAKLVVLSWKDEADLRAQLVTRHPSPATCFIIAHTKIPAGFGAENVSVIPHDAEAFARALYGELHRCDAAGAKLIVVESPPDTPEWSGIADRLRRAGA
jgi:L-threonylcarbamoyladenylate synthase